jgi:octaprenyl-diphosphate synthase
MLRSNMPAPAAIESTPDLDQIRAPVADDLIALDETVRRELSTDVALVSQVAEYIIGAGGKRLRPLLVLLVAKACACEDSRRVDAAAIIEFIHTATLLHDDVVDGSSHRRGRETANQRFGNQASVLVGDFLYSRSFQMMVRVGAMPVMSVMANATNTIAEGEVLQLINCGDPDTSETRYLDVIYRKTARLFEAGAEIAGVLSGVSEQTRSALRDYGRHLGTAYQLADDALDYTGDPQSLGKDVGDDLAEGKPTLPLIVAMRDGDDAQRELIRTAISGGGTENIQAILDALAATGAIEATMTMAQTEAETASQAIQSLPASDARDSLVALTALAVTRSG